MPQDFYDYLVSELALASKAYQAFNNDEALMHLQTWQYQPVTAM